MAKNNGSNMNDIRNTGGMDMNNMQSQNKSGNKKGSTANNKSKGGAQNSK